MKHSRSKAVPHQGQVVSGKGEWARGLLSFLYSVICLATCSSVLAVAERPTHRPMEKRTSPSRLGSFWRSTSSAQMSVAARPSWSRVSRRSV